MLRYQDGDTLVGFRGAGEIPLLPFWEMFNPSPVSSAKPSPPPRLPQLPRTCFGMMGGLGLHGLGVGFVPTQVPEHPVLR